MNAQKKLLTIARNKSSNLRNSKMTVLNLFLTNNQLKILISLIEKTAQLDDKILNLSDEEKKQLDGLYKSTTLLLEDISKKTEMYTDQIESIKRFSLKEKNDSVRNQ